MQGSVQLNSVFDDLCNLVMIRIFIEVLLVMINVSSFAFLDVILGMSSQILY
jgi:hypothetical protein